VQKESATICTVSKTIYVYCEYTWCKESTAIFT